MHDDQKPRRENVLPLNDILVLVEDVLGSLAPDRLVTWLGVSKRNAERWISGDSTFLPASSRSSSASARSSPNSTPNSRTSSRHFVMPNRTSGSRRT